MGYHIGKLGYVVLKKQATEGTPETVAGTDIGIPLTEVPDISPTIEKEFKPFYMKNGSEASDYIVKSLSAGGSLKYPAYIGGPLEAGCYGIFGGVDSTLITDTTTAYTNTFTMNNNTLPMFTLVKGLDELNMERYYDLRFGKMDISMQPGEDVNVSIDVMGKGGDITQEDITPTYTSERSFIFDDMGVSLGGSTNCDITSLNCTIDRGVKSMRTACAASPKGDNVFYPTTINVEGSIKMLFQDYTEYKYWLGSSSATAPTFDQSAATTKRALTITMNGESIGDGAPAQTSQFELTLPKIVYNDAKMDMPWDDRVQMEFNFKALYDATSEGSLAGTGTIKAVVKSELDAETLFA